MSEKTEHTSVKCNARCSLDSIADNRLTAARISMVNVSKGKDKPK
jgi:hypothetical protein